MQCEGLFPASAKPDLWQLKDIYWMNRNFTCLQDVALATKGRVLAHDMLRPQGAVLPRRRATLRDHRRHTDFPDTELMLTPWLVEAPAEIIYRALDQLKHMNIDPKVVYRDILGHRQEGDMQRRR